MNPLLPSEIAAQADKIYELNGLPVYPEYKDEAIRVEYAIRDRNNFMQGAEYTFRLFREESIQLHIKNRALADQVKELEIALEQQISPLSAIQSLS